MKKNIRFVLVILLVLLIVYFFHFVNECNQLKSTFSAFLVPNDPGSVRPCLAVNETIQTVNDNVYLFDSPLPLWNKVGNIFVYSAFWSHLKDSVAAVAIGVGPSTFDSSLFKCHVWFDFQNIIHSVTGTFSVIGSHDADDETLTVFNLICKLDEDGLKGKPYMFVILSSVESSEVKKTFVPIFYKQPASPSKDKLAICVQPDLVGVGKSEIVEFISFHQLIGLSDLIIYGNEINYGIIQRVKQMLSLPNFLRSISMIPWNFPYDNRSLELQLIETDCMLRTNGFARAFAILEWDQYIVPKQANPLLQIFKLLETPSFINFRFKSEICCIEQQNDKRSESSWPIVLQKTKCMEYPFHYVFKINGKDIVTPENVIQTNSSLVAVKTYRECTSLKNVKSRYDPSPFKFLSGLLSNNLLRLWNAGSLFL